MCTLTYIPIESGYVFTSNRDEKLLRPTSIPQWHHVKGQKLLFPKDEIGGGSWIAQNKKGQLACLLNGAFEKHSRRILYRRSRGQILLEIFNYNNPLSFWKEIDLEDIEPFTIVVYYSKNMFYEFRWDENTKHQQLLNPEQAQIWSSSTLYDAKTHKEKKAWFYQWQETHSNHPLSNMIRFHQSKHLDNSLKNILLSRPDGIQTVSISQIVVTEKQLFFLYLDLIKNQEHRIDLTN